jgi:hypothetical protein
MSEQRIIEDAELWDEFWDSGNRTGSAVRDCKHGITWFNPDDNGCFDDGELEDLWAKAAAKPDQYRATDGVHFTEIMGHEWCWSCQKCRAEALRYQTILWSNRHFLGDFLNSKLNSEFKKAREELNHLSVNEPGEWQFISNAPRNATSVRVRMKDGTIHPCAHWAQDLSGEEQPSFSGWFVPVVENGRTVFMRQIDEPQYWMPIVHKATL